MADFNIVAGDLLPVLTDTLVLPDGTAADLTGAAVDFHMSAMSGGFRRGGTGVIDADPTTGGVSYAWEDGDTDVPPGQYRGQWTVTYANTKTLHFPNSGYLIIAVESAT